MTERTAARSAAARPRTRAAYECDACGHRPPKWVGRCPECGEWGSIVDSTGGADQPASLRAVSAARRRCSRPGRSPRSAPSRPGSGRPGSASWTACSAVAWCPAPWCCWPASPAWASPPCCSTWPSSGPGAEMAEVLKTAPVGPALVVSGEESASQVRLRAERLGALHERLYLAAETDLGVDPRSPRRGQARPARDRLGADHLRARHSTACRAASTRSAPSPRRWSRSPRSAASPRSWSATSPRTVRSPVRGCWSTWSTSCCTSRATGTPRCAWCAA